MKQGFRFVLQPGTFFNQLQWSSNHWLILLTFLVLATIETQVGKTNHLYASFAMLLHTRHGIGLDFALWITTAVKLAIMLGGAFLIASLVYLVGSWLGRKNSRRVFYRRVAVVFTVALAAFTVQHFVYMSEWLQYLTYALYGWGFLLGFFAIREQFELNMFETVLVSSFTLLLIASTWHFSNFYFEKRVRQELGQNTTQFRPSGL